MVARKNVKPELGDSIRKLVNKTTAGNTVPYGVKAVEVDEGTNYYTPSGGSVYLDGLKLSEWDTTISDSAQRLTDAELVIDQTATDLDAAEVRLTTAEADVVSIRGGNIDVPGELAAKVVNAMDVNAKRLVVTEDAILNQVTVIEGIVTSELVANRIILTDLGYDLMQSASLVVTGPTGTVELSGSGYRAWNAQNALTVNLDGMDNLITGQLKTAVSGTRAELSTRLAAGSTNPEFGTSALDFFVGTEQSHGAIWYDSGANRFLNIYALPDLGFDGNTATGITLHNDTDAIQLNGRLSNSRAIQKGVVTWTSFAAGQYMTNQTVTFPTPFPNAPYITCQAQTENSTDIVITLRSRSTTGFTYNIVNQSSGNATGALRMDWIAIG